MSVFVTHHGYIGLALTVATVISFKRWKRSEKGREQWDRFKLRVPWGIGGIAQKGAPARFSRTYSALIAAGVPVLPAIESTGPTAGQRAGGVAMRARRAGLKGGGPHPHPGPPRAARF